MAYATKKELTAMRTIDPAGLRELILRAFREARAARVAAAVVLGCSRASFWRWVSELGIAGELDLIEERAVAEGWHHGAVGGRPLGAAKARAG